VLATTVTAACSGGSTSDRSVASTPTTQALQRPPAEATQNCPSPNPAANEQPLAGHGRFVDPCDRACILSVEEADRMLGLPLVEVWSSRLYDTQSGYTCIYDTITRSEISQAPRDPSIVARARSISIGFSCNIAASNTGPLSPDEVSGAAILVFRFVGAHCSVGVTTSNKAAWSPHSVADRVAAQAQPFTAA
jgi:hypothetical protein